jgi:hypothetical protein
VLTVAAVLPGIRVRRETRAGAGSTGILLAGPLIRLDHAPAGIAAASLRPTRRKRDARAWTEGGHGPEPKPHSGPVGI